MYDGCFLPLKKKSLEHMARDLPTNRDSHAGYSIVDMCCRADAQDLFILFN